MMSEQQLIEEMLDLIKYYHDATADHHYLKRHKSCQGCILIERTDKYLEERGEMVSSFSEDAWAIIWRKQVIADYGMKKVGIVEPAAVFWMGPGDAKIERK